MVIKMPVVPFFTYTKFVGLSVNNAHEKTTPCDRTVTKIEEILAKISNEEENQSQYLLLEFPDGIECAGELWEGNKGNQLKGGEIQIDLGVCQTSAKLTDSMDFKREYHMVAKWAVRVKSMQRSLGLPVDDEAEKWEKALRGLKGISIS